MKLLEGIILFIILNYFILKKNYIKGFVSSLFLVFYGCFRIFPEFFRARCSNRLYLKFLSMGSILSIIMILFGLIILVKIKKQTMSIKIIKKNKLYQVDKFLVKFFMIKNLVTTIKIFHSTKKAIILHHQIYHFYFQKLLVFG